MALDRDELAARCLVAMLSNPNLVGSGKGVDDAVRWADALLAALVPVAPASGAPAPEPRRTVGAVVRDVQRREFIVVRPGDEGYVQRRLDSGAGSDVNIYAADHDEFVRWATREECERHGIPYVARPLPGAPLAAPSRPEWVRITGPEGADYVTVGKAYRVKEWDKSSPLIENDWGEDWWCAATGDEIESSWPSWEPCAAPSPAPTPAAGLPVDESAFDEAKEREAARRAWYDAPGAAIGTVEREHFVMGWLARARVAAKGGAS